MRERIRSDAMGKMVVVVVVVVVVGVGCVVVLVVGVELLFLNNNYCWPP